MPIVYSYNYHKGLKKEKNEDAIDLSKNKKGIIMSVICDGVSSHKESSYSSNLIVKELINKWKKTELYDSELIIEWLKKNIYELNIKIIEKSVKKNCKMATTIVATVLSEEFVITANVGDSFTFAIDKNNENITLLTKDDSFVGVLLEAGVINKEEAKKHPKRHTLTQAIGISDKITIHINKFDSNNYSYILTCSDGLTTMLGDEEIYNIVVNETLSESIEKLIDKSNKRGGLDNISIAIFKILRGDNYDK